MTLERGDPIHSASPLVLVVEDDVEIRRFYCQALGFVGFRTDDAHNGLQALEKALAVIPDLILTDIALPGMDGLELCRRLRAAPSTCGVPVLAVTGYGDRHYSDRAVEAGADRVLTKPCKLAILIGEARRLIRGRPKTASRCGT